MTTGDIPAHFQKVTHSYILFYPEHAARTSDPHYIDFEEYRRRTKETAQCVIGLHREDFSECHGGLELHHAHVEFSLQNGVDLKWLEKDYPGISDPEKIGAWVESADNLEWLCESHHRGSGGVHVATASDYEAERYVRNLIKEKRLIMFSLAAIIAFALSVIFYAWSVGHGVWTWQLFMLTGLLCVAISSRWNP